MAEPAPNRIDLDGQTVEYTVRDSRQASKPRINVGLDGVTVVLPTTTRVAPERVLREHAAWVTETSRKFAERRTSLPDRRFVEGASFPYLDEPHRIVVERRSHSAVADEEFRLAAHHVEQTSIERALETLYRRLARERYTELAEDYAPEMGVTYDQIQIRNQRTKWGSCSSRGTLSLNWRVIMAPPAISAYLVVHELAHLREPNHSEAFWAIVAEYDPAYERHRAWLKTNGTDLIFTEADI